MNRLRLTLDEQEAQALLLMTEYASKCTWTDLELRKALQELASRIQIAVISQVPAVGALLKDKTVKIEDFA